MADQIAKRDDNRTIVLLGVTDDGSAEIRRLLVDPSTGRLKVSATLVGAGLNAIGEVPTGSINGSNTVFTLSQTPSPVSFLMVFLNGIYQTSGGTDYTLSGTTITFVSAPPTDSSLKAHYVY